MHNFCSAAGQREAQQKEGKEEEKRSLPLSAEVELMFYDALCACGTVCSMMHCVHVVRSVL